MTEYSKAVAIINARFERRTELEKRIADEQIEIGKIEEEYNNMLEALEYIGALSEDNTNKILDFITGVINNALAKIFPYSSRRIKLERSLYRDAYSHINLELQTEKGTRSLALQSGRGLQQIISFLFTLTLIEVRKERKLLIMDEILSGLHSNAKAIIGDIMTMFAAEGFQFICVEYGLNDIGKVYLVEKVGATATVNEFQGVYTDDIAFVDSDDTSDNIYQPIKTLSENGVQTSEPIQSVGNEVHTRKIQPSYV